MLSLLPLLLASKGLFASGDLYQVSAFEALRIGSYDGNYPVAALTRHGDFGLGTFNGLDGEMVVLDGTAYRINGFGDAAPAAAGVRTPFAFVTRFHREGSIEISHPIDSTTLQTLIDQIVPDSNEIVAIRIDGRFGPVQARSFAPQQKPYLPFAKIMDRQSLFPYPTVDGTFVGFRMPKSVGKGNLNVPGYHFHFLTKDRKRGGHVLRYAIESGTVSIMRVDRIVPSRL